MSSYKDLLAQREQLDKQIKEAIAREKADGIAKAKVIIEQYNLVASDLFSRKTGSKNAGGKVAPKYRNPGCSLIKPSSTRIGMRCVSLFLLK